MSGKWNKEHPNEMRVSQRRYINAHNVAAFEWFAKQQEDTWQK